MESNIVRCPDPEYAEKMIAAIDAVRVKGDSVGGVVTCIVRNAPRVSIDCLCLPVQCACIDLYMMFRHQILDCAKKFLDPEHTKLILMACYCAFFSWIKSIIAFQGLGSPVFDKLEAELAKAAMSLPATKGFEFGSGFAG